MKQICELFLSCIPSGSAERTLGKLVTIRIWVFILSLAVLLAYFLYGSHAPAFVPYHNIPLD